MGGSVGAIVNPIAKIVAAPLTGGLSLIHSKYNPLDKSFDPIGSRRAAQLARTSADQQKDAMVVQEADLKQKKKDARLTANNLAIRQRLIAQKAYASPGDRGGTLLTPSLSPSITSTGTKTLLGT